MSDMNGIDVLNVYQVALQRIKDGVWDAKDRVIVKMWNDALAKNERIEELKQTILDKERINGKLTHALDCFHSRENLKIMGQSNVGAYLKGLLDPGQIMTTH